MRKLMKKKVKIFKKEISVFLIVMIGVIGLVSAALIPYFGSITGSATVTQSVIVSPPGELKFSFDGSTNTAGKSFTDCGFSVKNNADVAALIQFGSSCSNTTGTEGPSTEVDINWSVECDGIGTEIYGILELDNKVGDIDSDNDFCTTTEWDRINDSTIATLLYSIVGDEFGYDLNAEGLMISTEYSLIYYADDWPGNNPGALIATGTSDGSGDLIISGSTDLGMSLPHPNDANAKETCDYCTNGCNPTDSHCKGAKIWLVPSSDYDETNKKLTAWNQANYLFETDLITYSKNTVNEITLPSNGGGFDFCIDNEFEINLVPDTYTRTTEVIPT